jgi:hypothetical protein
VLFQAASPEDTSLHQGYMQEARDWVLEHTLPLAQSDMVDDFDSIMERRLLSEAASVLTGRMSALDSALWEALFLSENAEDRESAIRRSVEQFQESVASDLADILAGRVTQEDAMPINLTEIPEDQREAVQEAMTAQATLATLQAEHEELKGQNDVLREELSDLRQAEVRAEDNEDLPQSVRDELRQAREERERQDGELRQLRANQDVADADAERRREFDLVPDEVVLHQAADRDVSANASLIVLADSAGIGEPVRRILRVAQEAIRRANILGETGNSLPGESEAALAITAAADAVRAANPALTKEQAEAKVFEDNPDLYQRYLDENPRQTGASH